MWRNPTLFFYADNRENAEMPEGVLIAIIIGSVVLIIGLVAIALFSFRGQQTGGQKTDVGLAEANKLKGTHVRTYVEGGGNALPLV